MAAYPVPKHLPLLNFASVGVTPEQILALETTEEQDRRAEELVTKEKGEGLTPEEKQELDYYEQQDHLLSMLKIRAMEMTRSRGS